MSPPIGSARAGLVSQVGNAIPDSQVIRSTDASSAASVTGDSGVVVNPNVQLNGLKAEISANTGTVSDAYIRDTSDTVLASTDISGKSSGNTFEVKGVTMSAGTDYRFTIDRNGSSYTVGYYNDTSPPFPFTTSAFDITAQWQDDDTQNTGSFPAINNIRNLNY